MNPSGYLSFTKRTLVEWMSGNWTQRNGIALAEGLCDFGGINLAEASMIGKGSRGDFKIIPWNLPYSWEKSRKTSIRVVFTISFQKYRTLPWMALMLHPPRMFTLKPCWRQTHYFLARQYWGDWLAIAWPSNRVSRKSAISIIYSCISEPKERQDSLKHHKKKLLFWKRNLLGMFMFKQ
jgi:ABC-type uncharacterized transport system permease subunit